MTNDAETQSIIEVEDMGHRIRLLWASLSAGLNPKLGPVNQGLQAEMLMPSLQIADSKGGFNVIMKEMSAKI